MHYRSALALGALAPLAAAKSLTVTSNCPFPVYLWNVVETFGAGPPTKSLNPGESWTGGFTDRADQGGGPCIKLKKNNNIFDGGDIAQVEYKMDPKMNTLFYDLSLIDGDPFHDNDVTMSVPSRSDCPVISCPSGVYPCPDAYYHPDDPQTKGCSNGGGDVQVTLCSGGSGGGSKSSSASKPKPAAPAPTTKAAVPKPKPQAQGVNFLQENKEKEPVVVTATTVVAVTVTKHMAPSDAPAAKREAHVHQHVRHHGHSRIMGRHAH